jgi:hypothetical protein
MATTWRVARSILRLFDQLQHAAPAARPRPAGEVAAEEWGTIGDAVHDPASDHSPKNFLGWGAQIVTAGDIPNRPGLGLDAHAVFDAIRRSRDPRVKYMISNDQICSSYGTSSRRAWEWGPYNPNDPNRDRHMTHGHLSVMGNAGSDGTQDWQISTGSAPAADTEDEDDMGASTPPIVIEREGITSLTLPPTQAGIADPRPAWLNFCNDTGQPYALRVWWTPGDESYRVFPGTSQGDGATGGRLVLRSGERWGVEIPAGASGLSISRLALDERGNVVDPAQGTIYGGHLTCAIERGAVIK